MILKKLKLHLIIIALVLLGCEAASEKQADVIFQNGIIYSTSDSLPFTGVIKDTIDGKVIEYEVSEGRKNGFFKTYFKNGKLEMSGRIQNNLNQGKWSYYYPSGRIESEGYFNDDLPEGVWKWYYENGNVKEVGNFKRGNREGKWILYDVDGNKLEEKFFKDNTLNKN